MKKSLWISTTGVAFIWAIIVLLFVSSDLQVLDPEELQKLRAGKTFWEWPSPYGSLAMHYIERGTGSKHVLLLHGFRGHTYTWRYLIEPLSKAGYHVWAIDLIGYGLSDKPDNVVYNVDFFVQQVKDFMESKGIPHAHLVGNSMGGGLALNVALSHPDRVSSLTLLSALGYPLDMPFYLSIGRHISQLWVPFLGPSMVRHSLEQIVFRQDLISEDQVEAYCLPYRFPNGVTTTLLTLQQFDNQFLVEMGKHYGSLTYPMLVIWGDHDSLIPVSHFEKFIKDFPSAEGLLISECGHIPQEERPQQVLDALLDFLQNLNFSTRKK